MSLVADFGTQRVRRAPVMVVFGAVLAATIAVVPIVYLVDRAASRGWAAMVEEIWRDRTWRLVARSAALVATVTVACTIIGVVAAWLVERSDLGTRSLRRALRIVFVLPLAVPSYLSAFAWISWRGDLAGFRGAALVLTSVSYPFVFLPVSAALRRLDPALEDVARSLGRRRWQAALLSIRQARTAITAGALLVALYSLSDFGAVAAMRHEVFTWVIYGAYRAGFDPTRAAILSTLLVGLAVLLVLGEALARGRSAPTDLGRGAARPSVPLRLGRAAIAAWLFVVAVIGTALVVPLVRIATWMLTYRPADGQPVGLWDAFTAPALRHTLWLGFLAAVVTTLIALPVGLMAARWRSTVARLLEGSTYVAHALPGIVVAISLVYVGVRLLRPIYQETPLLVLGYVVLFLPLAAGSVRSAIEQSPAVYEEISRSLGGRRWTTWLRITLPLAGPGIAAGAALVALSTMKELPVTLVLRPTSTRTLATELWNFSTVSDYGRAGPYALALILLAAVPTAVLTALAARHD